MQTITNYLRSPVTPGEAGDLLWATIYVLLVVVVVALAVLSMEWLERKILAHIQIRYGPMRVGPHGFVATYRRWNQAAHQRRHHPG